MRNQSPYEIADEAAAWVARMDAEDWSDDNEAELQAWLSSDPRRRGALLQAQASWLSLDREGEAGVVAKLPVSRRSLVVGGSALAASIVGGLVWVNSGTTYRTELGEIRRVPLSDGSTALINSDSEVRVKLAERRRNVRLANGEAWFRVAKDPHRPFVVQAGQIVVQAVGTAFSVRRRDQGADVIVTEGVVEVWAAPADGYKTRLEAGQRAFIGDNAAVHLAKESTASVERALAWRVGSIDLAGETLAMAVEDFNRYNHRKLILLDQRLANEQFDGTFRTDDPEGFAASVGRSFGVPVYAQDPGEIRIGGLS
jgi:transmembrane sensor